MSEAGTAVGGRVVRWDDENGWGVIDSPETPGGAFAHYSVIDAEPGAFRSLTVGETVEFDWVRQPQDGFAYRVERVRGEGAGGRGDGVEEDGGEGYASSLAIAWDDEK